MRLRILVGLCAAVAPMAVPFTYRAVALIVPMPLSPPVGAPTRTPPAARTLKRLAPPVCKSSNSEPAPLAVLVTLNFNSVARPDVFQVPAMSSRDWAFAAVSE